MTHSKWFVSALLGACITAGLFYFMQNLIAIGDELAEPVQVVTVVDATMPEFSPELFIEIDPPELIEPVTNDQPDAPPRDAVIDPVPGFAVIGEGMIGGDGPSIEPVLIGAADADLMPLVAIAPEYPARALQRGIEGWCLVEFTVDGRGNVIENSIVVVDAEPPNIFDRSSIRAVARFKYQPQMVNGQGVEMPGRQYLFSYELND